MNKQVIHSMAFGRAFWLDENDEFCSAPWLEDGTVLKEQRMLNLKYYYQIKKMLKGLRELNLSQ